jgi:hypothetical protein
MSLVASSSSCTGVRMEILWKTGTTTTLFNGVSASLSQSRGCWRWLICFQLSGEVCLNTLSDIVERALRRSPAWRIALATFDGVLAVTVRYGRQPLYAFVWLFLFWAIGAAVFDVANRSGTLSPAPWFFVHLNGQCARSKEPTAATCRRRGRSLSGVPKPASRKWLFPEPARSLQLPRIPPVDVSARYAHSRHGTGPGRILEARFFQADRLVCLALFLLPVCHRLGTEPSGHRGILGTRQIEIRAQVLSAL